VVVDRGGEHAFVHLALSHQLLRVELATQAIETAELVEASKRDTVAQGRELFHTANDQRLSSMTGISCSSCHLEGQSDNVTWRLDGKPLQTPVLAGRSFADAALRWHGDSPNLEHAVKEAITRLGGGGLEDDGLAALVAFLRSGTHEMAVQAQPSATAERGAELFSSAGCDVCHDPGSDYTDGQMHEIGTARFRTPSLRGLARSAPYYHDGSARSLGALLAARHADNPMAVGGRMSLADRLALEAFLKSL
jgi:cytochrome c peroxidase